MKKYIVKAYLESGTYYLTPELGLSKQFSEKVKWPATAWNNIKTINKCVKEDAQKYNYTYEIQELHDEFYTYKEKWNSERDVYHEK